MAPIIRMLGILMAKVLSGLEIVQETRACFVRRYKIEDDVGLFA